MSTHRASRLAVLALLFNALTWGVSWMPFRWLEARGLSSLWTTSFMFGLGLLALWLWAARAPRPAAPASASASVRATPRSSRPDVNGLFWLALVSGVTNASFNWAVTAGSVVRVVLLFYLMPIWAVLLARWLLGEPVTRAAMLRIALALCGALTVLWRSELGVPWPQSWPDVLAIVGGVGFAATNVLLRRLANESSYLRAQTMFGGSWLLVTAVALFASLNGVMAWPSPDYGAWLLAAVLMALVYVASNLSLQYGAARLPANVTAVVMLSEVLFASLSALMFGNEHLTVQLALGGAMIVLAAWLASRE